MWEEQGKTRCHEVDVGGNGCDAGLLLILAPESEHKGSVGGPRQWVIFPGFVQCFEFPSTLLI